MSRAVSSSNGSSTIRPSSNTIPPRRPRRPGRSRRRRVLRREDARPVHSGSSPVRRASRTSRFASQWGRNRQGAGVAGSGSGPSGRSRSGRPSSLRYSTTADGVRTGLLHDRGEWDARPRRDIAPGRRSERAQVRPHQVDEAFSSVGVAWPHPILGQREAIGATPLPGAGWRPRTRSTHSPRLPTNSVPSSPSSLTVRGPSASASRIRSARATRSRSDCPVIRGKFLIARGRGGPAGYRVRRARIRGARPRGS